MDAASSGSSSGWGEGRAGAIGGGRAGRPTPDALNWFDAGCVAMSRSPLESFSYASQLIDGDDLLVIARTSQGGKNQHDTNLVTLHRVVDFRNLALELRPEV